MIPWLGGVVALDAVENDLHLEDALHVAVEKRHGLPDELRFFRCRLFIIVLVFTFLQRLVGRALYSPQCDFDSNVELSESREQ